MQQSLEAAAQQAAELGSIITGRPASKQLRSDQALVPPPLLAGPLGAAPPQPLELLRCTALHLAAANGHAHVIEALLPLPSCHAGSVNAQVSTGLLARPCNCLMRLALACVLLQARNTSTASLQHHSKGVCNACMRRARARCMSRRARAGPRRSPRSRARPARTSTRSTAAGARRCTRPPRRATPRPSTSSGRAAAASSRPTPPAGRVSSSFHCSHALSPLTREHLKHAADLW